MTRIVKNITDLNVPTKDMERVERTFPQIAAKVMKQVINVKVGFRTGELVPVDTSDLARSWTGALPPEFYPGKIVVRCGYGIYYAVYVHEIPAPPDKSPKGRSARHKPPTRDKFLEIPINEFIDDVPRDLQIELDLLHMEVT